MLRSIYPISFGTREGPDTRRQTPILILRCNNIPVGFLLYGWTAQYHLHWMLPIVGSGILGFSVLMINISIENYLTEAFEDYKASAIAVAVTMRALVGALLPLAGPSLYWRLGSGWGNTVLALIGVAFIPALLFAQKFVKRSRHSLKSDKGTEAVDPSVVGK